MTPIPLTESHGCRMGSGRSEGDSMSKGLERKKEGKKKALHTKDEKRALKREKKRAKGLM